MSALELLLSAAAPLPVTYVEDVFATYQYTGNGGTQTITNNVNLSASGGMVWIKRLSGAQNHWMFDTVKGINNGMNPNVSGGTTSKGTSNSVSTTGWATTDTTNDLNGSNEYYVSWTFRKATKFFDIVTYTGDGTNKAIAHNLGGNVGLIIIGTPGAAQNYRVYHKSLGYQSNLYLNTTAAAANLSAFSAEPTTTNFSVTSGQTNVNGTNYVAYLFADDTTVLDGKIRCGTFTTDGSGIGSVTDINWESQFVLIKCSSNTENWIMLDAVRGWSFSPEDRSLLLTSAVESTATDYGYPTANGFVAKLGSSRTYVYLAIRRPNKPPNTGTKVLSMYSGLSTIGMHGMNLENGTVTPQDTYWWFGDRSTPTTPAWIFNDRLRGYCSSGNTPYVNPASALAEALGTSGAYIYRAVTNEITFNPSTNNVVYGLAKTAGAYDNVVFATTGSDMSTPHNLTVRPELIFYKSLSSNTDWVVATEMTGSSETQLGITTAAGSNSTYPLVHTAQPTTSNFPISANATTFNIASGFAVAYAFATLAGITKVGTYTGNGGSLTVDCGFAAGARFVLIKNRNASGDWYVWDTSRGIVSGNDPHLSLNTTSAEITTDDSIDPVSSGFIVNQVSATNINVNANTYIFLAIA